MDEGETPLGWGVLAVLIVIGLSCLGALVIWLNQGGMQ